MIVYGQEVTDFVSEKTVHNGYYGPHQSIGLARDGRIVAGAVFFFCTEHDCNVNLAAEHGAITRRLLHAWGKYVIDQLGCCRMTIVTEQPLVVSMAERLGGAIEGRHRNFYGPGRDGIVLGILKEHWRF